MRAILMIVCLMIPSAAFADYVVLKAGSGQIILSQSCDDCRAAAEAMEVNRNELAYKFPNCAVSIVNDADFVEQITKQEDALKK